MAKIGTIKLRTENHGLVKLPVYSIGDSGGDIFEFVRVQTESGTGFVPVKDSASAAFPFLKLMTGDGSTVAFHDSISSSFWSTDFSDAGTDSLPGGWTEDTANSSGNTRVKTGQYITGGQSLRTTEPSLGSGSDVKASTDNYSPSGDHAITLYTYADYANNSNQYTGFSYSNVDTLLQSKRSYLVRFKRGDGNDIEAYDGNGYVKIGTISENVWRKIRIEVHYSSNEYYVTLDSGTKQGPFGFIDNVTASEVPHFKVRSQNYTFWTDDITTESI